MTNPPYSGTIDWDQYWNKTDEKSQDDANGSVAFVADAFFEFIEATGIPESYADVGCGAGVLACDVADRHPETTVVGYDAAKPVVDANVARTTEAGLNNISFNQAVLPDFDPGRQFELVSCFYTLCYVADSERALRALYDAVAPGGYLVFTYHNRYAQSIFRRFDNSPGEYLDESSPWDPETFSERFELVIDGENLLSYERIHDTLGSWPQSVWSMAERTERYSAWRQNPLVYVPK